MSKGLEIVKYLLKQNINESGQHIIYDDELKVIEKELIQNEMLIGIGGRFFDESFKQNKVLEIIKKRFTIQFCKSDLDNYYGIMQIGINPIYIKSKEEYDLLKGELE